MPAADRICRRLACVIGVGLLALAGCERSPAVPQATDRATVPPSADEAPVYTAPAKPVDPDEAWTGASYEVGIASAAANRKQALKACETRPAAEREDCVAQAEADWETAKSTVDDLRGEQQ